MNVIQRLAMMALALPPIVIAAGCAAPAAPQPPSLKLPNPVADLTAIRTGDEVRLHWTMPRRTTDRVLLRGAQQAHICRRIGAGSSDVVADQAFGLDAPADFIDHLPAAATSGPARPMTYTVELLNPKGANAGPSNPALTAAGAAPLPVEALSARAVPEGVLLQWTPAAETAVIRIHRTLLEEPDSPKPPSTRPDPSASEQILEVTGIDRGRAIDRDAALNHTYRYSAERVEQFTLESKRFELLSTTSQTITVNARDIFPPAVPVDLQAVAYPEGRAIDLSWAPNTERDLAGYIVYRRDTASSAPAVRVSSPKAVAPSFRDASALPGHKYAYSVSAIDRDGNESPRSAETEESLPQQQEP
jgi:hypothetical protein